MPNGSKATHVAVTPDIPNGKEVPVHMAGPCVQDGQICLDPEQAYDITFQLTGANGVNGWRANDPFGNQPGGACPTSTQGASAPFTLQAGTNAQSFVVHMDAQASGYETHFRLNFNDSFTCDPIMVVN